MPRPIDVRAIDTLPNRLCASASSVQHRYDGRRIRNPRLRQYITHYGCFWNNVILLPVDWTEFFYFIACQNVYWWKPIDANANWWVGDLILYWIRAFRVFSSLRWPLIPTFIETLMILSSACFHKLQLKHGSHLFSIRKCKLLKRVLMHDWYYSIFMLENGNRLILQIRPNFIQPFLHFVYLCVN